MGPVAFRRYSWRRSGGCVRFGRSGAVCVLRVCTEVPGEVNKGANAATMTADGPFLEPSAARGTHRSAEERSRSRGRANVACVASRDPGLWGPTGAVAGKWQGRLAGCVMLTEPLCAPDRAPAQLGDP